MSQRYETAGVAVAPPFEMPIVVGLEADERQLVVLGLGKYLTAEARKGGEAH